MIRVNILSEGFVTPNGCAFLFPLVIHKNALFNAGIEWNLFTERSSGLIDCDILILESKFYRDKWRKEERKILDEFSSYQSASPKVFFFDTGDSSGWLQSQVLPFVDGYRKSQLLQNRSQYLQPMYGHRPFTNYYHSKYAVDDVNPGYSRIIKDEKLLEKLAVSWNSGLADYSLFGPNLMSIYKRIAYSKVLRFPKSFSNVKSSRYNEVSCRFGVTYSRETISWQRKKIRAIFAGEISTKKMSRRMYFKELVSSKVIVSPFGLGEITLKDFEVFLTGGLLLKPDMNHMETWPNFFQQDKTMCTFGWDAEDLKQKLEDVLLDDDKRITIANEGQRIYRHYTTGNNAAEEFCLQFKKTSDISTYN